MAQAQTIARAYGARVTPHVDVIDPVGVVRYVGYVDDSARPEERSKTGLTDALDSLLAESANASSPFFGALDASRMGMSGHSFGGFTVFFVVNQDSRFKVAIPMAPATSSHRK